MPFIPFFGRKREFTTAEINVLIVKHGPPVKRTSLPDAGFQVKCHISLSLINNRLDY
jgi:hypothetical protein